MDSCAMSAARLTVEAEAAMSGTPSSRARELANIARDCDMLAQRYGALARELEGGGGDAA